MTQVVNALVGGVLALAACGAQAQAPGMQLNMDTGFYIGAGIGKSRTGEGCFGVCDVTDRTWSVMAGYQLGRHFAVEAAYSDFGETTTSGTLVGVPASARVETTAWELVAVGLLPLTDNFSFYAKAGVYRYDGDAVASGAFVARSNDKGTELTLGGGVQYSFAKNFAARFEYQSYLDVGTGVFGLDKDDLVVWRLLARYKF